MCANECYLIPHTVCKSPEADEIVATPTQSTMTFEQAATLKQLAEAAYELDAFKPNLTRTEAENTDRDANGQAQTA